VSARRQCSSTATLKTSWLMYNLMLGVEQIFNRAFHKPLQGQVEESAPLLNPLGSVAPYS